MTLELKRTKDILAELGATRNGPLLVGFALETANGTAHAREKLRGKHLDFIVLNNPRIEGAGFDTDTNIVTILSKSGKIEKFPRLPKFEVGHRILDRVAKKLK
jgi:phosphopantothenoylcysteine decarboxylase/phosphopantothenate--cysteine ligase